MTMNCLEFCRRLGAAAALGLALGGCATVELSSPGSLSGVDVKGAGGKADRVLVLQNEGYYLFHSFPIVTGDVTWSAEDREIDGGIRFFSHQLSGDCMMTAMGRYAESLDCDLVDLVINNKTQKEFGFMSFLDFAKIVVGYNEISYSAVLRPRH